MTSNIIKFVHKNKIVELSNPNPNETLLNFIRTKLKKTGTKEGWIRRVHRDDNRCAGV